MRKLALILGASGALLLPTSGVAKQGQLRDGGLAAAVALVRARGFTPNVRDWQPGLALNVLTATLTRSADGYNQRAFFFYRGRYLGTDASTPSLQVSLMWENGETIALMYVLYRPRDSFCCPTGGGRIVRFHWNGQRLVALDRIPPHDLNAPLHR